MQPILQERLFSNPKIEVLWNTGIEEVIGDSNPRDPEMDAYRLNAAQQNVADIRASSVFWYLVSKDEPGRGGYFETGVAFANGSVLVFSGDTRQSVFCALGREHASDMAAFCEVVKICHQEKR